jgi:hypothetical protein
MIQDSNIHQAQSLLQSSSDELICLRRLCDSARVEVQLTVGIYEISEENTPGVGTVLNAASLTSIPEAHCYCPLKANASTSRAFRPVGPRRWQPFSPSTLFRRRTFLKSKWRFMRRPLPRGQWTVAFPRRRRGPRGRLASPHCRLTPPSSSDSRGIVGADRKSEQGDRTCQMD